MGAIPVTGCKNENEAYVLCRPRGGLNDTLCQIERCWLYAEDTGRTLLVDASRSSFASRISEVFQPRAGTPAVCFDPDEELLARLDTLTCHPRQLCGRLATYRPQPATAGIWYVDAETSAPLTFDFRRGYRARVLVHENVGGGPKACHFLERVVLAPALRDLVLGRLADLLNRDPARGYLAVHVRNTDIRTDFERLFASIAPRVQGRTLLVCSDDAGVVRRAREVFTSSHVVSVGNVPDRNGAPLHLGAAVAEEAARRAQAVEAIVDLVALGGAETVFHASDSVLGASRRRVVSGFSRLAAHLAGNKHVLDALLQRETGRRPSLRWQAIRQYHRMRHRMLALIIRCRPRA